MSSSTVTDSTVESRTLEVPGAQIHYEVRGAGPVLAIIGAPMGSTSFQPLAEALAATHTVVTYDPRGSERTTVTDRTQSTTPELLADDVHRVLAEVTDEPVALLGSSGGAVTGLALVTAHPEQVEVLIAHEPPVLTLLDNADEEQAVVEDIHQTYLRAGSETAMRQFVLSIGVLDEATAGHLATSPLPEPVPAPAVPENDQDFFLANQIRATTGYRPGLAALQAAPTRIVVAVGSASTPHQLARRAAVALAEQLGRPVTEFPGDHGGFMGDVPAFAARLGEVLHEAD